jgi:hypothetical protein
MKLTLSLGLGGLIALGLWVPFSALACPPRLSPTVNPGAGQMDYVVGPDSLQPTVGQRVGSIRKTTTRDHLTQIFGAANLEDFTSYGPEGIGEFPATKLMRNGNDELHIIWQDASRKGVSRVQIYGGPWHTADGLAPGTPLTQLRQMFGEFKFYGFAWDYGGLLILDQNPKLAQYLKARHLSFDLGTPRNCCKQFPQETYLPLMGDQEIATTDPRLTVIKPEIRVMSVYF